MDLSISWHAVALRLLLTVVAGLVIGFDRGEHARPVGMRTTLLVALAASVAMIQANLLMPSLGKTSDSFVVLDLMRLPLGILSGMGFIGAGAILRKDGFVLGVTTAATLWFVTVMGLCFGGGQLGLGIAALGLGIGALEILRRLDEKLPQDHEGIFKLLLNADAPNEQEIRSRIEASSFDVQKISVRHFVREKTRELEVSVHWRAPTHEAKLPAIVREFAESPGVSMVEWKS